MYGSVYVPYNIEREKNSSALIDNSHFQSSPRTLFPRSTYRPEFDDRQSHGFMILFFHFISLKDRVVGSGAVQGRCTQKESHRCLLLQVHRSEGNEEKRDAHFTACRHQTRQQEKKAQSPPKKEGGRKKKKKIDFTFIATIAYPTTYSVDSLFPSYPNAHRRTLTLPLG